MLSDRRTNKRNRQGDTEKERLLKLLVSLLLSLDFDVIESREIYDEVLKKKELNIRNLMELINYTFSINKDLTMMRDVPQIFDFEKSPIEILREHGRKASESERKEFVLKVKSYLSIDFTKLIEIMSLIGFSIHEQYWITTRLELIHNTEDGPISINKVISKMTSMIQRVSNEMRSSFIEIVSVYDHYESFK
jgi:hypothetical protein